MSIRWGRLTGLVCVATVGIGGSSVIAAADDAPRGLLMIVGVLGLAGVAALAALLIIIYAIIEEDVRPSFRFRKPAVPLAMSHSEASMKGWHNSRNHPVTFWGGLTLNNRFFFGFMLFGEPEYERLRLASVDTLPEGGDAKLGSVRSKGSAAREAGDAR